jgi:hypothetical protein
LSQTAATRANLHHWPPPEFKHGHLARKHGSLSPPAIHNSRVQGNAKRDIEFR